MNCTGKASGAQLEFFTVTPHQGEGNSEQTPPQASISIPHSVVLSPSKPSWLEVAGLLIIAALFLALRAPVMYLQAGGYDEDFYAVPGLTILRTGIPQLPHVPARNPESVFLYADTALYSEPPLYFYFQAAFYSVLPHVYGTGRLASAVAGLGIVACVYGLSRAAGAGVMAALAGAALLSLSRWFYFPAICARPDTLCGLFGLAAILALVHWRHEPHMTALLLVGILLGLGGLTHFFAIIYAMQIGLVVAWWSRGWKRLVNFSVVTTTAIVVFCAWVPLIALAPDVFKSQLANQLGGTSGGPMWLRVVQPWASLRSQVPVMWEHIGGIQCVIPAAATLLSTYIGMTRRNPVLTLVCGFAWSAMYLICVMVGPDHPVYGYWAYPAGLMFVALACALDAVARVVVRSRSGESAEGPSTVRAPALACAALATVVALLFLPGSGLRTLMVHLQHWNDVNYNAPRFAQKLINSVPEDEICAVDAQFVLDFVAAGRRALAATDYPPYFRVDQWKYDRLIVSRHMIDQQLAQRLDAKLDRTEGIEADKFACYAEIYDPPGSAASPVDLR